MYVIDYMTSLCAGKACNGQTVWLDTVFSPTNDGGFIPVVHDQTPWIHEPFTPANPALTDWVPDELDNDCDLWIHYVQDTHYRDKYKYLTPQTLCPFVSFDTVQFFLYVECFPLIKLRTGHEKSTKTPSTSGEQSNAMLPRSKTITEFQFRGRVDVELGPHARMPFSVGDDPRESLQS